MNGEAPPPGALLVRKDLAASYRQFAKNGSKALYGGPVGDKLVAYMQKNGGLITKQDLLAYKVIWRKPIETSYRNIKVYGAPINSSATCVVAEPDPFLP